MRIRKTKWTAWKGPAERSPPIKEVGEGHGEGEGEGLASQSFIGLI